MTAAATSKPRPGFRQRMDARALRVCNLYTGGLSMEEVGARVGMSRSKVHGILHRYGVAIRVRGGRPREIMSAYGPAEVLAPSLDELRGELGLEVPAVGLSAFEHVANIYEPTATIIRRKADERLRNQEQDGVGE